MISLGKELRKARIDKSLSQQALSANWHCPEAH